MELQSVLEEIGLTAGEAKVYLALVKLGSVPVNKIKEETTLHRTAIYDFVERLMTKGLANYVIKNNIRYYKASEPIKLIELLKEREHLVENILPTLDNLSKFEKDDVKVEVYKGKEGLKTMLNDIIRTGKECVNFGIDDEKFQESLGPFLKQYFLKSKEAGVKERCITYEGAPLEFEEKTLTYRFIPKEFFNPTVTEVYGDKVAIIIWEPLIVIVIENSQLADSYRKYFEMLWLLAKNKKTGQ